MSEDEIEVRVVPDDLAAKAFDGDTVVGECEYIIRGGVYVIMHTGVRDDYGGRGIAGRLVAAVVDAARAAGTQVLPLCSYAKREFEKHPEYADVLDA